MVIWMEVLCWTRTSRFFVSCSPPFTGSFRMLSSGLEEGMGRVSCHAQPAHFQTNCCYSGCVWSSWGTTSVSFSRHCVGWKSQLLIYHIRTNWSKMWSVCPRTDGLCENLCCSYHFCGTCFVPSAGPALLNMCVSLFLICELLFQISFDIIIANIFFLGRLYGI